MLTEFFRFNMLDEGVKGHVEQKRTERDLSMNPTTDSNKWGVELFSYDAS